MNARRNSKNLWSLYEKEVPHSRFCDPACGVGPAEKLTPDHLHLLQKAFRPPKVGKLTQTDRKRGRRDETGIKFEEFRDVLTSAIGPNTDVLWVKRFFSEVDISCTGEVTWQQLCSYLLLEHAERHRASIPTAALLDVQPQFKQCSHNKREPTVRAIIVSHASPPRYITVSRGGLLTVWSNNLHILKTLTLTGDPTEEVANTRRFRGWTTDAAYMSNVHVVAVSTDHRDLHFVNVGLSSLSEEVHLYGFRSVPTALCYYNNVQCPLLLVGDEKGGVHLLRFLNISRGLFKNSSKQKLGPQRIFLPNLDKHDTMVSYQYIPKIHQEPINRLKFDPASDTIMTSSESDFTSVVFTNVSLKPHPYVWKFKQGAKCFDYNPHLLLLVTGGCDQTVRMWTRYVTSRPVAMLRGHRAPVLDVAIYQPVMQIFSYSRDSELRIWDVATHLCLKSVRLQFPCLRPGHITEHGNFPFLLLSPPLPEETQPHLIVSCKDYLACLNLAETRRGGDEADIPSFSCLLFNPTLGQVVTGHVDSSVSVWETETGKRCFHILNAHGEETLTCMELDSSHRRLITGARNGTIKVWNLLNGLNLHKLEPITNSEVTGLACLNDNQLLAVGWSQQVIQYDIAGAKDLKVKADMSWKSAGVHKSDILSVCQCSSLGVVATASYDGEVIIWRLETQRAFLRLRAETQERLSRPVDGLLFLLHRAGNKTLRNRGVLVSSQAGSLCFWGITGCKPAQGQFYAPEQPGQRVLAMSSDQTKNNILVSGDTSGSLQIWDISSYALGIQQELTCERPPRLQSWRVDKRPLVCVEVVEVAGKLYILAASAEGSAGLWSLDGGHVGHFGQEMMWTISDSFCSSDNLRKQQENLRLENLERDQYELCAAKISHANVKTSAQECSSEDSTSRRKENENEQPQQPMYLCEDALFA